MLTPVCKMVLLAAPGDVPKDVGSQVPSVNTPTPPLSCSSHAH